MLVAQKYVSYLDHSRVERQTWEDIYCGRFVNGIDTQVSNIFEHINGRFTRASNMYTIDKFCNSNRLCDRSLASKMTGWGGSHDRSGPVTYY